MKVEISQIVKNIGKNVEFMQPVYEAIVNSLEANATKISVQFHNDEQFIMNDVVNQKLSSFTIIDNGDGFTNENITSFETLWSKHKITLGAKGSGRFTWLNVFDYISISSHVKSESKIVNIPFSLDFTTSSINTIQNHNIKENKTIIKFKGLSPKIFSLSDDGKPIVDRREESDINLIYDKILNNLLIKLFLLKRSGVEFNIEIKIDSKKMNIDHSSIPELNHRIFTVPSEVKSDRYGDEIEFELYYDFKKDNKKSKKAYFCAHERSVRKIDDDGLGFSASLPNNDSMLVLVCSTYLDDNVDDDRSRFVGIEGSDLKHRNVNFPILLSDIKSKVKQQINDIILFEYPEIVDINKEIKENAIDNAPFLSKYIKENSDLLVSESSLIKEAKNRFNKEKVIVKNKFQKLLKDKDINIEQLETSIDEVSEIAIYELAEYVQYRDSIVKALESSLLDTQRKESFIHKIFIPKNTTILEDDEKDYKATNLWLLDDKFMTFSFAFSDTRIKDILSSLNNDNKSIMELKRPDSVVLYNEEISRDALIIEFKGVNATLGEKEKAISEINRNALAIKESIKEINSIWAYIITSIDEEFGFCLRSSGYEERFTNDKDGKIYYKYNPNSNSHIVALDLKALTSDAIARNKTFLDILKNR